MPICSMHFLLHKSKLSGELKTFNSIDLFGDNEYLVLFNCTHLQLIKRLVNRRSKQISLATATLINMHDL